MHYASGVSDNVIHLCNAKHTIASALAAASSPSTTPCHDIWEELYPKPFVLKRLVNRFTIKHDLYHGRGDPTEEDLDRAEKCGKFPYRPSDLFLKIFSDVLLCLERDPLAGICAPPLLGTSGVMPLTIISVIPDIMQHYYDCIVRAHDEVILATNYWQPSNSVNKISSALKELSVRHGKRRLLDPSIKPLVVKIMWDRGQISQAIDNHAMVNQDEREAMKLPKLQEIPHLTLEVMNFHRPIMGTFHAKFLIIDRKVSLLNSNNIQDRPNLEMMIHLEGAVVEAFYDIFLYSWHHKLTPLLPCLQNSPSSADRSENDFKFAEENPYLSSIQLVKAAKAARAMLRSQKDDDDRLARMNGSSEDGTIHGSGAFAGLIPQARLHAILGTLTENRKTHHTDEDHGDVFGRKLQKSEDDSKAKTGFADVVMKAMENRRKSFASSSTSNFRPGNNTALPPTSDSARVQQSQSPLYVHASSKTEAVNRQRALESHSNKDHEACVASADSRHPNGSAVASTMPSEKEPIPRSSERLQVGHPTGPGEVWSANGECQPTQHSTGQVGNLQAQCTPTVPNDNPLPSSPMLSNTEGGTQASPLKNGHSDSFNAAFDEGNGLGVATDAKLKKRDSDASMDSNQKKGFLGGLAIGQTKSKSKTSSPLAKAAVSGPPGTHTPRQRALSSVLNAGALSEAWSTVEDTDVLDEFNPHTLHKKHDPFPIAMVCRKPHGLPGHQDIRVPQDAAWLAGFRYAEKSVFIQTPTFNAKPIIAAALDACRRGIQVTIYVDLGFNDKGESMPFQGGTNEEVVERMYRDLNRSGHQKNLHVYWYTGKDQVRPLNAVLKQRNCHVKFMQVDGHVGIQGNGNQDTQSWYHSCEINVMVDSKTIVDDWMSAIYRQQNTELYGRVDDDGVWRDKSTGKTVAELEVHERKQAKLAALANEGGGSPRRSSSRLSFGRRSNSTAAGSTRESFVNLDESRSGADAPGPLAPPVK